MTRIISILIIVLVAGCSKPEKQPKFEPYSFNEFPVYTNNVLALLVDETHSIHNLEQAYEEGIFE